MDKRDNFIVVHPTPKANNNLKREPDRNRKNQYLKYGDDIYYRDVLLEKLAEEIMKFEVYKAKITELEKRIERLEKSKIVTAPLKSEKPIRKIERVDVKTLSNDTKINRAINTYSTMSKSIPSLAKQSVALEVKEEKISFWQKIKKAVKLFFLGEDNSMPNQKEQQTWNEQSNMKYNQFRQSIPKTTIQIDTKNSNNTKKREQNHIFDRYA